MDLIEKSNLLNDETKRKLPKISITNIERILGTPDARKLLGVDVKGGHLSFTAPDNDVLGKLAKVVEDVANRRIKVTDLDTKEQRVEYAQQVAAMPVPRSKNITAPTPLPLILLQSIQSHRQEAIGR